MEATMSLEDLRDKPVATQIHHQQMPLTFLHAGEKAQVLKVRGSKDFHHHLENLGFVPGAPLRIVSAQSGNYIIEVKGAQIALDKSSASKIITG